MCGIAGLFTRKRGSLGNWFDEISYMVNCMRHRGPDDMGFSGICFDNCVVDNISQGAKRSYEGMMGFARLSIRDLSINGRQPMISKDRNVVICFNGEIYNADQYRELLKAKGHCFHGTSDTEVVLNLYLEYGIEDAIKKLNGMFGIAICDVREKCIWLIRDRVGIKPLYYTVTSQRIAFASEIKAFLGLHDFERKVSERGLTEVMTFCRPQSSILLEGVEQVPPGHIVCLKFDAGGCSIHDNAYFCINDYERPTTISNSMDSMADKAKELLFKCSNQQKASDVKVGCQLSGGIDSSLITYAANQYGDNRLNDVISIVFDDEKEVYSEEAYVDIVAAKLKQLQTHKKTMTCEYFLKNYERVIWHSDTVIGRPNSVGLFLISETAKEHVTVLLSGEGSDELLGGYNMFKNGHRVAELLSNDKRNAGVLVEIAPRHNELIHSFAEYAVMVQQKTPEKLCRQFYPEYNSLHVMQEKIELFQSFSGTCFDKQIKYALSTYLQELLMAQDKMSMANSIENRVPFLDNDFIDFAFSVPESMLMCEVAGTMQGKYILKYLSSGVFGEEFAFRKKMGFPFPFYKYMKNPRFKEYFYSVILPGTKDRGIYDASILREFYENLNWNDPFTTRELFWKVFSFETWCQLFIDHRDCFSIL